MIVTQAYTKIPNQFFDLVPEMKGSVVKIMLAYFRHSSGFHKDHVFMSFTDFQNITGLKRNTVNNAIKDAVNDNWLRVDPTQTGDYGKTCYVVGEKLLDEQMPNQSQKMTTNEHEESLQETEMKKDDWSQKMTEQKSGHEVEPINEEISHKVEPANGEIGHKVEPHIKEIEFKEKNTKENIIRDERGENDLFELDQLFADLPEPAAEDIPQETDSVDQAAGEPVPDELPVENTEPDTPYTAEEYAHFKDRVSQAALETDVYNPCHNISQVRADFGKPTKQLSDWQQLVAVVENFFPTDSIGYAAKLAQQLAGTAKSGQRKEFASTPAMNAVEACAFAYWLREGERLERLPERAERIQERVMQFRALGNHFEHVNFARYILSDLLASNEQQNAPDPDPDLHEPASKELLDKVYADAYAALGFRLDGDV